MSKKKAAGINIQSYGTGTGKPPAHFKKPVQRSTVPMRMY
jgi:hypothetical protein